MYQFNSIDNLEDLLLNTLGIELLVPSNDPDIAMFFHNGDRISVNLKTGAVDYEPLEPGNMAHSRIALRFHQWWGKGLISPVPSSK